MNTLDEDLRKAMELGVSYGKYKVMTMKRPDQPPKKPPPEKQPKKRKRRSRKYSEEKLFQMWQDRKTDSEIAEAAGVSRAMVQRWRDSLELPSTYKNKDIDTKKFRMVETTYGIYILQDD